MIKRQGLPHTKKESNQLRVNVLSIEAEVTAQIHFLFGSLSEKHLEENKTDARCKRGAHATTGRAVVLY